MDYNPDPVRYENGQWGFYDETWSEWHGPYVSEKAARAALAKYCRDVLGD